MTMTDERPDVPRNDLIRGVTPVRAEDDGNTMVGYPIVFDRWTEINSWEGRFMERVLPSGPVQALKSTADRIKVNYNHGMHPLVGTSGLGKPRVLKRDDFGVYAEVPLSQTSYNRDIIKPQLQDGTLDGMSFRFSVVKDEWVFPKKETDHNPERLPERSLVEFKWPEFGPVDWPAYQATQAGIRSQAAFALWLRAPAEARSEVMTHFHIEAPRGPQVWAPGWEPKTSRSADTDVTESDPQEPPAGEDATEDENRQQDQQDQQEDGPDDQATRSEQQDEPTLRPWTDRHRRQVALNRDYVAALLKRSENYS